MSLSIYKDNKMENNLVYSNKNIPVIYDDNESMIISIDIYHYDSTLVVEIIEPKNYTFYYTLKLHEKDFYILKRNNH